MIKIFNKFIYKIKKIFNSDIILNEIKEQNKTIYDFILYNIGQNTILRDILYNPSKIPPASGILKEMQEVNFYLLKKLKTIADAINIQFWLHGGSLLGAVRHNSFIPWDDDIDIGILREDFNLLIDYLKSNKDIKFEVKNYYVIPGICARQPRFVFKNQHNYFFIDIFVYDNLYTQDITNTWSDFVKNKMIQVDEIVKTKIHSNNFEIPDIEQLKVINSIFDNFKFRKNVNKSNAIIFDSDIGTNLINNDENAFVRCFDHEFIFPLKTFKFNNSEFFVPNNYEEYLIKQYGDYKNFPQHLEYFKHLGTINKSDLINIHKFYIQNIKTNIVGYTAGAFDLFHVGHLNLLRNSRNHCDYLIVGVSTDELIESTKGYKPITPLNERVDILKSCKYVDKVVIQDDLNKIEAYKKYKYDVLFSGDDWKGNERWTVYEKELNKLGIKVIFFPYTKTTNSTAIKKRVLRMPTTK